jgi:hypothetical protein
VAAICAQELGTTKTLLQRLVRAPYHIGLKLPLLPSGPGGIHEKRYCMGLTTSSLLITKSEPITTRKQNCRNGLNRIPLTRSTYLCFIRLADTVLWLKGKLFLQAVRALLSCLLMKMKSLKKVKSYPKRAAEVPVTQVMLYKVRDGLESKISAQGFKVTAVEHKLDVSFKLLTNQIKSVEANLQSQIHKIALLVEEQNAKNNIVLDGLTNLFARQERIEDRLTQLEK